MLLSLTACQAPEIIKERLFTVGDSKNGALSFPIPEGGSQLIIQPVQFLDRSGDENKRSRQAKLDTNQLPYSFRYEGLDSKQEAVFERKAEGLSSCSPVSDRIHQSLYQCSGERISYDLMQSDRRIRLLNIRVNSPNEKGSAVYFKVTLRAKQSEYRSRIHWIRLSSLERDNILKSIYQSKDNEAFDRMAMSTLAPTGKAGEDYRDAVAYSDSGSRGALKRNFPAYSMIGPGAKVIAAIYPHNTLVRIRSLPFHSNGTASPKYHLCWQPFGVPVDGPCYRQADGKSAVGNFRLPRGRIIISSEDSMAIDVDYAVDERTNFHLSDSARQYKAQFLASGQSLSFDLAGIRSAEYLPVRINAWSVMSDERSRGIQLSVKILDAADRIIYQQSLPLSELASNFDRIKGQAMTLGLPKSLVVDGNVDQGKLLVTADSDVLISALIRRTGSPLVTEVYPSGFIRATPDERTWVELKPKARTDAKAATFLISSYSFDTEKKSVLMQRVAFASLGGKQGVFSLVPSYNFEQALSERIKTGRSTLVNPGQPVKVRLETVGSLSIVSTVDRLQTVALKLDGKSLWQKELSPAIHETLLAPFAHSPGQIFNLTAEGAPVYVAGVRPLDMPETSFVKRFFYEGAEARYELPKELAQQNIFIDLLLTQSSASPGHMSVTIEKSGTKREKETSTRVSTDYTYLKRDYVIQTKNLQPDTVLFDGRKAQFVSIPIALYNDLPEGRHTIKVSFAHLDGAFVAVSGQMHDTGLKITSLPNQNAKMGSEATR